MIWIVAYQDHPGLDMPLYLSSYHRTEERACAQLRNRQEDPYWGAYHWTIWPVTQRPPSPCYDLRAFIQARTPEVQT